MKVKEYIEKHFEGEIRERVIAETVKNESLHLELEIKEELNPSLFLECSFMWKKTKEGYDFWKNISESFK